MALIDASSARTRIMARDHRRYVSVMAQAVRWSGDRETFAARDDQVSGWSVGQQLEHLLRSNRGIIDWLARVAAGEDVDRRREKDHATPVAWIVLLTGYIPRGRGRAPDVTGPEGMEREAVEAGHWSVLAEARRLGEALVVLGESDLRMSHPIFGAMTAPQWLRFGRIHHEHHQKIIRDILDSS